MAPLLIFSPLRAVPSPLAQTVAAERASRSRPVDTYRTEACPPMARFEVSGGQPAALAGQQESVTKRLKVDRKETGPR